MSITVVIRSNGKSRIFNGPINQKRFMQIAIACGQTGPRYNTWTLSEMIYVKDNYRKYSASQIALALSLKSHKKFTKNMVIRMWHKLKRDENRT